jgi:hypothetical protein
MSGAALPLWTRHYPIQSILVEPDTLLCYPLAGDDPVMISVSDNPLPE